MKSKAIFIILILYAHHVWAQNTGIGTMTPQEKLEVQGAVKIGTTQTTHAGTIRWNPDRNDFEGYNGTAWVSLTGNSNAWGRQHPVAYDEGACGISLEGINGNYGQNLGRSMVAEGELLIAGAPWAHVLPNTLDAGKVYILKRSTDGTWPSQATSVVQAPSPVDGEHFGYALAYDQNQLAVSAPYYSDHKGRVLIYTVSSNGSTMYKQAFAASDGATWDFFGYDVSMDGDFLFVSAPGKTVNGFINAGKVYVYKFNYGSNLWTFAQGIPAPEPSANDYFGQKMVVRGNRALVSAPQKDVGGQSVQGKVYYYTYNGNNWSLQQSLIAPDGDAFDEFGFSMLLQEDTMIISAPQRDLPAPNDNGKVYLYTWSGAQWNYLNTLIPALSCRGQQFGTSLHTQNGYLIIGAPGYDEGIKSNTGLAYIFKRINGQYSYQVPLASGDSESGDEFGTCVWIHPDYALISSPGARLVGNDDNGRIFYFYH